MTVWDNCMNLLLPKGPAGQHRVTVCSLPSTKGPSGQMQQSGVSQGGITQCGVNFQMLVEAGCVQASCLLLYRHFSTPGIKHDTCDCSDVGSNRKSGGQLPIAFFLEVLREVREPITQLMQLYNIFIQHTTLLRKVGGQTIL